MARTSLVGALSSWFVFTEDPINDMRRQCIQRRVVAALAHRGSIGNP